MLGASLSDRRPHILELAERLDATKVAKSWWKKDQKFEFVAAALADLPRLSEFANAVMPKNMNHTVAKAVFEEVRAKLEGRYDPSLPKAAELYPAIFGVETERDDRVMSLVKESIFVNSVKQVMKDEEILIEPIVSLFMLSAAARAQTSSFAELVQEFPDQIELTNEGRPLEWCAYWWLRMRLATAAGKENFSLAKLLGVEEVTFDGSDRTMLKKLEKVEFTVPSDASNVYTKVPLRSSRNKNTKTQFFGDMGCWRHLMVKHGTPWSSWS